MTTALRKSPQSAPKAPAAPLAIGAARLVLLWERVWPPLPAILAPAFLILILGLFGVWRLAPAWLHLGALVSAGLLTIAAIAVFARRLRWPTRREALERLERDGRLAHAPLQALEDRPFGASADHPLWRAHMEDMKARARAARLGAPRKSADAVDPFSLRFLAPGLLLVGLVAAGPETGARVAEAFSPQTGGANAAALADVWIEPPAYTGKAPIYLLRAGETVAAERGQIDAPQGSIVVAQGGARAVRLALRTANGEAKGAADPKSPGRTTLTLAKSGVLTMRVAGAARRWLIGVLPDRPPTVAFAGDPSTTDDARLAVTLSIDDDYGVVSGELKMRLDPDQQRPLDAPPFDEETIRERRIVALDGLTGKSGDRNFDLDLQSDPWAGLVVIASFVVKDGAGQTGESDEKTFRLPAKPFYNPLARAVVEQRQTLAVAPSDWPRAGRSLDALTLAPEKFYDSTTDYLLMRAAFWRVMRSSDEGFSGVVNEFWPLALQLEDQALELARRRLEAAQDALRKALEEGASDEKLNRLVEELRAAMQDYLQALAQSGEKMADSGASAAQTLDPGDLDKMLDQIRNLAQSGAERAARQALNDLSSILNNLRLSSGAGRGSGQSGQASGGPASEAGDLIGRQRDLANRSFERGQSYGARGGDLAGEEGGIAGDLKKLLDKLPKQGSAADPGGKGAAALGEALSSMREAQDALNADNFDAAGTAMEQAIAKLRDGAEALAEAQMKQAQGRNGSEGAPSGQALDPLGRPIGSASGQGVDIPEKTEQQRAREILDELRQRLSDGKRDQDEIQYLERLLERY